MDSSGTPPSKPLEAKSGISLDEFAARLGLAVGTVSRALNGNKRVSEATRARVAAAARELGYTPSPLARGLRMGRSGLVGICFHVNSPSRNMVVSSQLYALQQALKRAGKRTLVEFSDWEYDGKVLAIDHFLAMRAEGVVHVGSFPPELLSYLEGVRKRGVPYVLLDPGKKGLPFSVGVDRTAAYAKLTDHLLDLGHRRFLMLGILPGNSSNDARIEGVRSRLNARGLRFEECVRSCFDVPLKEERAADLGYRLAGKFFHLFEGVTACMASNDDVAVGVIAYLKSKGLQVPRDLSVVGFDDTLPHNDPPLTTVSHEVSATAEQAVAMLLQASASGGKEELPPVVIEPVFHARASSGPAPL